MELLSTLDINGFHADAQEKELFVNKLKTVFSETGFFFLENHGMSEAVINKSELFFREFFTGLSFQQRLKYENKELQHQVGYTPMKVETGEFSSIPDEKHFFQAGDRNDVPVVEEIENFTPACMQLFYEFRNVGITLLKAIALSLDLPENYFDEKEGNSIMRAIHYPASQNPPADDDEATRGGNHIGMCASKHTDINMITLLLAREPGLELWYENKWIPITITNPNVLIVNCGDMLEHLTGGRYRSGLHRVVCEKNKERYSVPFFCHLKEGESLVPLSSLGKSDAQKFHFNTAGEFLQHRLVQIGL